MKSIANQYRDLKEGRMSQANFMRNLRMSMPQYVTNVTSFNDAVKILKNKSILTESDLSREAELGGIEDDFKNLLAKGYSYYEALELIAQNTGMDPDELESMFPQDAVDVEGHEDEDAELEDMIARAEEEESGKHTKFYDFPGAISEVENTSLRNPNMAAKAVAQKHYFKLIPLQSDFKQFEREAIQLAGEEMLAAGMNKIAIRNLLSGYGYFEDWIPDYLDALKAELKEDEAPEDYEDPDMFDAYGMDASEGLNEKSYKVSKDAIPVSSLKKGDVLGGSGLEVVSISAGAKTPSGKMEVTVKDPKTGKEVTKVWGKATKVTVKKDLKEAKKKKEKVVDNPNQFHPQEVRMGIKVELEHTDDLDKAKKIAMDHLRENPFYYTELKLSGLDAAHTTVQKPAAPKKAKKVKPEMVDKANQMQKVKLVKEAKFNAMPGEEPNSTVQHAIGFIQSNPVLKQISDDIVLQNDGENAVLKYGYWEALPDEAYNKLELQFVVEEDYEGDDEDNNDDFENSGGTKSKMAYILYPKHKPAEKYRSFQSALEEIVREVLAEMHDGGSEDLAAMAKSSNALRHKPETQAIAKKAAESANNKEEAASLAVKLAKAKGITDSEQITHIVDLATSKFMNETFDGRDNLDAENEY